jgi:hypothetical protein
LSRATVEVLKLNRNIPPEFLGLSFACATGTVYQTFYRLSCALEQLSP